MMSLDDQERFEDLIEARDARIAELSAEVARLREALEYANGCFIAADVEGWSIAILSDNMEQVRDIWNRRINFAWEKLQAALATPAESKLVTAVKQADEMMRAESGKGESKL